MSYIPEALRQQVIDRAQGRCEYCLIHQQDSLYAHEIDHVIPEKHRGVTSLENLCLACLDCNRHKGSDFASFDPETGEVALLFNPREQSWSDHFRLEGARIVPTFSRRAGDRLRPPTQRSIAPTCTAGIVSGRALSYQLTSRAVCERSTFVPRIPVDHC